MKHSRLVWIVGILAMVLAIPVLGSRGARSEGPSATETGQEQAAAGRGRGQRSDPLPPNWLWWQDEGVQADLALTPAQVTELESIYAERRRTLTPYIREFFRLRGEINSMAGAREVTPEEFGIKVAAYENLDAKISESRTVMLYRMSLVLDDEQFAKVPQIRDRRGGRRSSDRERRPE